MGHVHLQPVTFQHVIQCRPVHAGGLHDYRLDAAVLQPACHPMEVGCEAAKALYRFRVAVCGHSYAMFCTSHVDPRCIYIQWQKSVGRIHVPGGLPSLASLLRVFRHRVSLQLKSDGPGPVANRFMNLSNGVEPADQSQPTAANSLIARNRSHTRKRAQGHHISRGLDCRERPRQHLTLIPFLVPLTALRCPLLGSYPETLVLYRKRTDATASVSLDLRSSLSIQPFEGGRFVRGGRYGISIDFCSEVVEKKSICGASFKSKFIDLTIGSRSLHRNASQAILQD